MQDRYAGDIGDYVKLALLRALGDGERLGVAWYLHPDEDHNDDGRHRTYLDAPARWRHLDHDLFDALGPLRQGERSVAALEQAEVLPGARFCGEQLTSRDLPAAQRCVWRAGWFARVIAGLDGCTLVFADPDNGMVSDDPRRRRSKPFGKQIPLAEARHLAADRTAVIYHHNTRFPGGHDLEVAHWCAALGPGTIALRATAWSCRTFFVVNPTSAIRQRAEAFAARWATHRVHLHG
jgi:hypothetical protein